MFKRVSYNNYRPLTTQVTITLQYSSVIKATDTFKLNLTRLPEEARLAYIFTNLKRHSIISIRQIFAAGCQVVFTYSKYAIYHNNKVFLEVVNN